MKLADAIAIQKKRANKRKDKRKKKKLWALASSPMLLKNYQKIKRVDSRI